MKGITTVIVFLLFSCFGFSQNFLRTYTQAPYVQGVYDAADGGVLVTCYDHSVMGLARKINSDTLIAYRIDDKGTMMWRRMLPETRDVILLKGISCTDSTVSWLFMAEPDTPSIPHLIKMDMQGNLLWDRSYFASGGFGPWAIAPASNGEIIMTGTGCAAAHAFLHVDRNGHIINGTSQSIGIPYARIISFDLEPEGADQFFCFAYLNDGSTNVPLCFYHTNSSGMLTDLKRINFSDGVSAINFNYPAHQLTRAPDGGHFIVNSTYNANYNDFRIVRLNAADSVLWSRNVEYGTPFYGFYPFLIQATADSGCIVEALAMIYLGVAGGPSFMKFDAAGNLQWVKFPCTYLSDWNYYTAEFMTPSGDHNGFYISLNNCPGINIWKTDSLLSGSCVEDIFAPAVSMANAVSVPISISSVPFPFTEVSNPVSCIPVDIYTYEACSKTIIDSVMLGLHNPEMLSFNQVSVFPNPATEVISIANVPNGEIDFVISDYLGQILQHGELKNKEINISGLPAGLYFIQLNTDGASVIRKFIKL